MSDRSRGFERKREDVPESRNVKRVQRKIDKTIVCYNYSNDCPKEIDRDRIRQNVRLNKDKRNINRVDIQQKENVNYSSIEVLFKEK